MTAIMELSNIYKSYRQGGIFGSKNKVSVLENLNLSIKTGKSLGLLGASGCGKSTAARLLLGLEKPDSGKVLYKGKELNKLSKAEYLNWRRNTQVVFQNSQSAVNPRFKAWEILAEPLRNFEKNLNTIQLKTKAEELLIKVGLSANALNKWPYQFSGGELQRICIARALALNPEFIIFDESVSALDMINQTLILNLISELKGGCTFLFISHDIRVILKISDYLAVMEKGTIVSYTDDINKMEPCEHNEGFRRLAQSVLPAEPSILNE